ncbi:MAG: Crp/Fnr family transcriptional regulator [Alphaproteobacteria bacterium]|nr:Crp/Fnr family transcriptional regulator [Alphaproteobacteria bacterium]
MLIGQLGSVQTHRPNARLIDEGQLLERPRLIRSGWACRARYLTNGRRQILNFYLPGEIMGLSADVDGAAQASYVSLTRLSTLDLGMLRSMVIERPHDVPAVTAAFHVMRLHEEYHLLSQVVRIGQQKAFERVAHLLLEFHARLSKSGLTEGNSFQLPLTQEVLGDGLGLSAVHVNRTFKLLKRKGYVKTGRSSVTLLEPEALSQVAGYREPMDYRPVDRAAFPHISISEPTRRPVPAMRPPAAFGRDTGSSPNGRPIGDSVS